MSRPRLTRPGATDMHWMSVVCTPETTHVEFHELSDDANQTALTGMLQRCSAYVGAVTLQGEHKFKPTHAPADGMTVVLGFTLDREMRAALHKYNGANKRADYANTLRGLLVADLEQIRDDYRRRNEKP